MSLLLIALLLFLALHSIPAIPPLRAGAVALLGRRTYLSLYSLVSLLSLGFLFHAGLNTPYVELWTPAGWQAAITLVLSPLGLFFVLAGLLSPNPLSITLRAGEAPGAIVTITRHPVLWGFTLWSLGHVIVNGDLRSLVLFGGLGLFSVGGFFMLDRRARHRLGPAFAEMARHAPLIPFTGADNRLPKPDAALVIAAVLAGLSTWALLAGGHAALFGADPLTALQY